MSRSPDILYCISYSICNAVIVCLICWNNKFVSKIAVLSLLIEIVCFTIRFVFALVRINTDLLFCARTSYHYTVASHTHKSNRYTYLLCNTTLQTKTGSIFIAISNSHVSQHDPPL